MYQVVEELKNQPSSTITVSDNNDGYWYYDGSLKELITIVDYNESDVAKDFMVEINSRGYKIKKCYSKIIGYIKRI